MGARQKLNSANVNGALVLAMIVGVCFESLNAFIVAALFFIASSFYTGDLRAGPGRR